MLTCRLHHTWNHLGQGGHQLGCGDLGEPQAFGAWGLPFRGHVGVLFPSHGDRACSGVVMTSDTVRVTDSVFLSTSGDSCAFQLVSVIRCMLRRVPGQSERGPDSSGPTPSCRPPSRRACCVHDGSGHTGAPPTGSWLRVVRQLCPALPVPPGHHRLIKEGIQSALGTAMTPTGPRPRGSLSRHPCGSRLLHTPVLFFVVLLGSPLRGNSSYTLRPKRCPARRNTHGGLGTLHSPPLPSPVLGSWRPARWAAAPSPASGETGPQGGSSLCSRQPWP